MPVLLFFLQCVIANVGHFFFLFSAFFKLQLKIQFYVILESLRNFLRESALQQSYTHFLVFFCIESSGVLSFFVGIKYFKLSIHFLNGIQRWPMT